MNGQKIKLLYEHDDFLVCEKPHGLAFHTESDESQSTDGFVSLLRAQLGSSSLYPVHRLDRVTSGAMLVAKNSNANSELSQLFQSNSVSKIYLAISDKKPKKKQGVVSGDMQKARGGSYKLCRTHDNASITRFYAARFDGEGEGEGDGGWAFWLMPQTGKTHQLRVVCKSLGSPILGDTRYGGTKSERCFLHAYQLGFRYKDVDYCINAEPQEAKLQEALAKLLQRKELQ